MHSHRGSRAIVALAVLAGLVAAEPAPVSAQGSSSFGLWGGVYTPLGKDVNLGGIAGQVERDNSVAGGVRLTFWGPGILGLEAVGGYSPAKTHVAGAPINSDRNLNVFATGLKLMVGISPHMAPLGFHVGGGPALIRRGSDVTSQSNSETKLGAVVGAGVRLPLASSVALRVDGEDYIYQGTIGGEQSTRNDLMLTAGLSFGFGN